MRFHHANEVDRKYSTNDVSVGKRTNEDREIIDQVVATGMKCTLGLRRGE